VSRDDTFFRKKYKKILKIKKALTYTTGFNILYHILARDLPRV